MKKLMIVEAKSNGRTFKGSIEVKVYRYDFNKYVIKWKEDLDLWSDDGYYYNFLSLVNHSEYNIPLDEPLKVSFVNVENEEEDDDDDDEYDEVYMDDEVYIDDEP